MGTATGATHPGVVFHVGTNYLSGTNNASHITIPSTTSGGSVSPTTTLGDMIVRGASVDERLAIGYMGAKLSSQPFTNTSVGPYWSDQLNKQLILDNFKTASSLYGGTLSGSGSSNYMFTNGIIGFANDYRTNNGFVRLMTASWGTSGNKGYIRYASGDTVTNIVLGERTTFDALVAFDDISVTATNAGTPDAITNMTAFVGLGVTASSVPVSQSDFIGFVYRPARAAGSSSWLCGQATGGTITTNTSGFAAHTNGWMRLSFICSTNTGTIFFTNGVAACTNTTVNLPIGARMLPLVSVQNVYAEQSFSNRTSLYLDYLYLEE